MDVVQRQILYADNPGRSNYTLIYIENMNGMKKWVMIVCVGAMLQQVAGQNTFYDSLSTEALVLTTFAVDYDPSYKVIAYPGGDVAANRGVCTDVIIRAYRRLGIDLQKAVHEDMTAHFDLYPKHWGLKRPDKNIDHRRVPNLMTFFTRHGIVLPKTTDTKDYQPGDIVCWNLGHGITHIGIVVRKMSDDGKRYKIVHNIGAGQTEEDMLFHYKIIGHYRYPRR